MRWHGRWFLVNSQCARNNPREVNGSYCTAFVDWASSPVCPAITSDIWSTFLRWDLHSGGVHQNVNRVCNVTFSGPTNRNGLKPCVFFFEAGKLNRNKLVWVPYNKLLNNLAYSSCTKEYWPSVRTIMTSGRYSQYGPSLNYNLTSRWRSNRIWGSNGRENLFPEKQNHLHDYHCGHQGKKKRSIINCMTFIF